MKLILKTKSTQMKKKKGTPVFSCKPNGEMYDVVDGILIPKQTKKIIYKSKTKSNAKQNRNDI